MPDVNDRDHEREPDSNPEPTESLGPIDITHDEMPDCTDRMKRLQPDDSKWSPVMRQTLLDNGLGFSRQQLRRWKLDDTTCMAEALLFLSIWKLVLHNAENNEWPLNRHQFQGELVTTIKREAQRESTLPEKGKSELIPTVSWDDDHNHYNHNDDPANMLDVQAVREFFNSEEFQPGSLLEVLPLLEKGKTNQEISDLTGIHLGAVRRMIKGRGDKRAPDGELLAKIKKHLDT